MKTTEANGTVEVSWRMELPHSRVDTESLMLVITDALRAHFAVRPRMDAPIFDLYCECTEVDVKIEEDERHDPPAEFDKGLQWYVETFEGDE